MKRLLLGVILVCAPCLVRAADGLERALYWCHHNGHTNATLAMTEVLTVVKGEGALSYIGTNFDAWKIGSPPSKAVLEALDGPTVDAWMAAYMEDLMSPDKGFGSFTRREKFFLRCVWKLAKEHWPALTFEQFLDQLRSEWDASKND